MPNRRVGNLEIFDAPAAGQRVFRLLDKHCHSCGKQLNTWDARCSKALKYKNLVCEKCIAKEYGMSEDEFRDAIKEHLGLIPCEGI